MNIDITQPSLVSVSSKSQDLRNDISKIEVVGEKILNIELNGILYMTDADTSNIQQGTQLTSITNIVFDESDNIILGDTLIDLTELKIYTI
jgi:uncharacterized protein YrrD